jgi:hypothetical protein
MSAEYSTYTKNLWIDLQLLYSNVEYNDYNNTVYTINSSNQDLIICLMRKTLRALKYKITRIYRWVQDNKDKVVVVTNIPKDVNEKMFEVFDNWEKNYYDDSLDD